MAVGIDESLLTAYALDELSGAERAAVAAHLGESEEARRYVADVRATAHILSDELTREHFGELDDLQHPFIERHVNNSVATQDNPVAKPHVAPFDGGLDADRLPPGGDSNTTQTTGLD